MEEIKFRCTPVNERYYSDDSSFGVFVFHTTDDIPKYDLVPQTDFGFIETRGEMPKMSTLAGKMQRLFLGTEYQVTAKLDYNSKYKTYQYNPIVITAIKPKTKEQQHKFLCSIITKQQADVLLDLYPNIVEDIVNSNDKVDLSKTKGIKERTYERIKEKVFENYVISDILVLLQPLGVSFSMIRKLLNNEPNPVLLKEKLMDNPYIMTKIKGFGFNTVDTLALKLNPDLLNSKKRLYAFIEYYFDFIGNNDGHTWMYVNNLEDIVKDTIPECSDIFNECMEEEKNNCYVLYFDGDKVGLKSNRKLEESIFNTLIDLNKCETLHVCTESISSGIKEAKENQGFELTAEQLEVVDRCLNQNVSIITGCAGSGKTSISRTILSIYKNEGYTIGCCALSAKAAQRIIEATGFQASTIHKLLEVDKMTGGFKCNKYNRLPHDVILIDECSMINSSLYYSIISAVKDGAKVIMCGDNAQLPPIGCGNIFGDLLLKSDDIHVERLTKVMRQAEKSGILSDANKVRRGIMPIERPELKIVNGELQDMYYMFRDDRQKLRDIAIKLYMDAIKEDGVDETVIIAPRKEKCCNSTFEINTILNDMLTDKDAKSITVNNRTFRIGSKVIQTENDYEKNVFNGEVGYIKSIDSYKNGKETIWEVVVEYCMNNETKIIVYNRNEMMKVDFAYAYTCHKCQGSGYKTAIIIIDMTHYTLLDTCLLYTAITRAKKRCLLLAEPSAFKMCMDNNKSKERNTWLKTIRNE